MTAVSEATGRFSDSEVLEMYRRMARIRRFEERTSELYRAGEVPGFVHLSIGQEATAVGACWALESRDGITSNHRGHGHCLAKGLDPGAMFAELMGREAGTCRGRGGSMHIADPEMGVFGANGIVGAGLPIAVGVAAAARQRGENSVVVAFFGDGAVAQGMFHEAVNLAALWRLPIVFFCENNGYAEFSPVADQHPVGLAERAVGYGIPHHAVDGNNVVAVSSLMTDLVSAARQGAGPVLVEAATYRWHGHYEGDPERYRTSEEVGAWKQRDPLEIAGRQVLANNGNPELVSAVDEEVRREVDTAVERARGLPAPEPTRLFDHVLTPRAEVPEPPLPSGEPFKLMHAVRAALEYEMKADPAVFVAGIDVAAGGNVFGLFRGLADDFPGRVLDTPISETAIVGIAVGAAMAGMRPVVEIMYMDFLGVCFDQLLNQAAKLPFMTGGKAPMSMVVRTQFGAGRSSGSQHSQSLEALLAQVPGLTVVMPATPADAYGLLRAAIHDPNPVVFVENRLTYGRKGPRPPADHLVPLGKAAIVRPGRDLTVVSYSRMLHEALAAAEEVSAEGIEAEVIDLRTVAPLDRATVLESLSRTHRLLVAHEAVQDFGVGAELAAMAANEGFWYLDAPVVRIAAPMMPAPYAPSLESEWLPDRTTISAAMRRLVVEL